MRPGGGWVGCVGCVRVCVWGIGGGKGVGRVISCLMGEGKEDDVR